MTWGYNQTGERCCWTSCSAIWSASRTGWRWAVAWSGAGGERRGWLSPTGHRGWSGRWRSRGRTATGSDARCTAGLDQAESVSWVGGAESGYVKFRYIRLYFVGGGLAGRGLAGLAVLMWRAVAFRHPLLPRSSFSKSRRCSSSCSRTKMMCINLPATVAAWQQSHRCARHRLRQTRLQTVVATASQPASHLGAALDDLVYRRLKWSAYPAPLALEGDIEPAADTLIHVLDEAIRRQLSVTETRCSRRYADRFLKSRCRPRAAGPFCRRCLNQILFD